DHEYLLRVRQQFVFLHFDLYYSHEYTRNVDFPYQNIPSIQNTSSIITFPFVKVYAKIRTFIIKFIIITNVIYFKISEKLYCYYTINFYNNIIVNMILTTID